MSDLFEPSFSNTHTNDTLVLVDKQWIANRKAIRIMVPLLLAAAAGIFFILLQAFKRPDEGLMAAAARVLARVNWGESFSSALGDPALLLKIGVPALLVLMYRAQKSQRLILSPEGIRFVSHAPWIVKRFLPDWSLAWNQITAVELGFPAVINRQSAYSQDFAIMTFVAGEKRRHISATRWVNAETCAAPGIFSHAFRMRGAGADLKRAVAESEVGRYISARQPHLPVNWDVKVVETMTSLEKTTHSKLALALLAILGAYTFSDLALGSESYVDGVDSLKGLTHLYVAAGIAGAALSGIWLSRSVLKSGEKVGLALLIGAVTGFAMIPGALRINEFIGGNELITYDCHVIQGSDGVILQPLAQGVPPVTYFAQNEYWQKFGKNDLYPVRIRRGVLGFYQFDAAVIIERIKQERNE